MPWGYASLLWRFFFCLAAGPLCLVPIASITFVVKPVSSFSPFPESFLLVLHLLYTFFIMKFGLFFLFLWLGLALDMCLFMRFNMLYLKLFKDVSSHRLSISSHSIVVPFVKYLLGLLAWLFRCITVEHKIYTDIVTFSNWG